MPCASPWPALRALQNVVVAELDEWLHPEQAARYEFTPLDPTKREIRLLEILPPPAASFLKRKVYASVRMSVVSLNDGPSFAALSYVWGSSLTARTILVDGVEARIQQNLAEALKEITATAQAQGQGAGLGDGARLWADALCINQRDVAEKNQQVALMADIYSSASRVVAWLGTDAFIPAAFAMLQVCHREVSGANHSLETLRNPAWQQRRPELHSHGAAARWKAVLDFLLHSAYWSRMWIFQEVVLSKRDALVFFGPRGVWVTEAWVRAALEAAQLLTQAAQHSVHAPEANAAMWDDCMLHMVAAGLLMHRVVNLLDAKEKVADRTGADRVALSIQCAYDHEVEATDPRDFYYGVLGVAGLPLVPDYSAAKTADAACRDFVAAYVAATAGSPHVLAFLLHADRENTATADATHGNRLPSWAPRCHIRVNHTRSTRFALLILSPQARASRGVFDAPSGPQWPGQAAHTPVLALGPSGHDVLRVVGVRAAVIRTVARERLAQSFLFDGGFYLFLLDVLGHQDTTDYVTGVPVATALFATMERHIGDGSGAYDATCPFLAVSHVLRRLGDLQDNDLHNRIWSGLGQETRTDPTSTQTEAAAEAVVTMSRKMQVYSANQNVRLFASEEGYMGLVPPEARAGDLVCILDGCQYPVVLRATADGFSFVSVCYTYGLMEGEARRLTDGGRERTEVFELV